MRHALVCLIATLAAAAEPPTVRELVDRLKQIEAQVALIERESALPVDRGALWAGAARGMVEAADPHGSYLSAAELAIHGLGNEPMRVGFGFDWRRDPDGVLVTRVVPGSPAAKAGLHPGCRILAAGEAPVGGDRRSFAESLARGPDRKVLRIRPVSGEAADVDLTRTELHDDGLSGTASPAPGILHLRIGRFLPAASPEDPLTATATAVREAIRAAGTLRAAVLDLRGCAGGSLQAAVEVASCWLPPGAPIIEQAGRDPARARSLAAIGPRQTDAPVVVLVDADTASSAEVVALALRRGRRAPLVGTPTHGKWSVQQLFMLPGGDAMNLTVARLHTGDGQEMSGPLQPDIGLPQDASETWLRLRDELAGEARPSPDRQLERACELAATLALAAGR